MNTLFKTVTSSNASNLKDISSEEVANFNTPIVEQQSIHISDLELEMFIGIHDEEKNNKQRVIVNIDLNLIPNKDWLRDNIDSVVSYADITDLIIEISNKTHIELVETFAHQIIDSCFDFSENITSVAVKVDKPEAISGTKSVGCFIKKVKP